MPNHIQNRLIVKGERAKQFLDSMFSEGDEWNEWKTEYVHWERHFDFNKIIPMPQELDITAAGFTDQALKYFYLKQLKEWNLTSDNRKFLDEYEKEVERWHGIGEDNDGWELVRRAAINVIKYGSPTWYGWSVEHWSTKWNAYETERKADNEVWFQTAWSMPFNVIQTASVQNPDLVFEVTYADEDTGCNCGEIHFKGGEKTYEFIPDNQSMEAYNIAFEMRPYLRDEMVLVDGEYRWKEDVETDEDDVDDEEKESETEETSEVVVAPAAAESGTEIHLDAGVRYWEDGEVDGVKDVSYDEQTKGISPRMPFAVKGEDGEYRWKLVIDAKTGIIKDWPSGMTASIHYKVCDDCEIDLFKNGEHVCTNDGYYYCPDFLCPDDEGYGDYIIMTVDGNGQIQRWDVSKVEQWATERIEEQTEKKGFTV